MMAIRKAATDTDTVLVVSPSLNSTAALAGILEGASCPLTVLHSPDCEQALAHLTESRISVVICETFLPDGSRKDLLDCIGRVRAPSVLVVTSKLADEPLWAEVLNLGGYDDLAQPFDREEVTRVVRSAVRASSDHPRRRLA
jgi:DNA-binding NtrC family response regulator